MARRCHGVTCTQRRGPSRVPCAAIYAIRALVAVVCLELGINTSAAQATFIATLPSIEDGSSVSDPSGLCIGSAQSRLSILAPEFSLLHRVYGDDACDTAKAICFAALDLDPVTCGYYYGHCYKKDTSPPIGDNDCRNSPCGPGCPSDLCIGSGQLGLTVPASQQQITSDAAPGAAASGNLSVLVAKRTNGNVAYNWWNLGQGLRGWQDLDSGVRTNVSPAAALVGKYLFVIIKGNDGYLYLNQGTVNGRFIGWRRMDFQTDVAAGAASTGTTSVVVAKGSNGHIFYNWWELGQGGSTWAEIPGDVKTASTPTAILVGHYLFVVMKSLDGTLYLNQGGLGKGFVGWQNLGFASSVSAAGSSSSETSVIVGKNQQNGFSYSSWRLGGKNSAWISLGQSPASDFQPAAALVSNDYLFVAITGRDGHIYLNQGTLDKPFIGWR
jgi:hypothetical protein